MVLWVLLIAAVLCTLCGCAAPVNIEPLAPMMRQLAEVTFALSAAVISMETNQTAGGNINDPWVGRLAMAGSTIVITIVVYMAGVRPARRYVVNKIKNGR